MFSLALSIFAMEIYWLTLTLTYQLVVVVAAAAALR
jgi:hypothetical protein